MKRHLNRWRLYVFIMLACVALFLLPPANQAVLIGWMIVVYGGIAIWIYNNQSEIARGEHYHYRVVTPVAEFLDEDRRYLQEVGTEIPDDNLLDNPHEAA